MTKWAELRDWSPRNRDRLDMWLSRQVRLEYDITVAQNWGLTCATFGDLGRGWSV